MHLTLRYPPPFTSWSGKATAAQPRIAASSAIRFAQWINDDFGESTESFRPRRWSPWTKPSRSALDWRRAEVAALLCLSRQIAHKPEIRIYDVRQRQSPASALPK